MSDQVEEPQVDQTVECAICGKVGNPPKSCTTCLGGAKVQERQYTLSELRNMSHEEKERALGEDTRPSGAPPRIVQMPGSA